MCPDLLKLKKSGHLVFSETFSLPKERGKYYFPSRKKHIIMKTTVTFLACVFCFASNFAQTDGNGAIPLLSQSKDLRTPALDALYQEAKTLENTGSYQEIEANRLALKAAWQAIDPAIAALYKPIEVYGKLPETMENVAVNGTHFPATIQKPRPQAPNARSVAWVTDRLVHTGFIDGGVDMEATASGDIFISGFLNDIIFGGPFDIIYIYRSTDGGLTFQLFDEVQISATMQKMELVTMDGTGDDYLLAYFLTDSGAFQVVRWNITAGGGHDADLVATDVIDFSVDTNFPVSTSDQRVFATFIDTANIVFSARSTSGSYGFDWVDQVAVGLLGKQVDFAYGMNGGCFTTFVGANSGNLYADVNDDYNDPVSWYGEQTLLLGADFESKDPVIAAACKPIPNEEVLVIGTLRATGATDGYTAFYYLKEDGAPFAPPTAYRTTNTQNFSVDHLDAWVRKSTLPETIRTSHIHNRLNNSSDDKNFSMTYDGTVFGVWELVSDPAMDVFDGFPSAIAETNDGFPCVAFAGTTEAGGFDYGTNLYFDGESPLLDAQGHTIEGLSFHPNPVREILNISAKHEIESISFHNVFGQTAMRLSPGTAQLSVDTVHWPAECI